MVRSVSSFFSETSTLLTSVLFIPLSKSTARRCSLSCSSACGASVSLLDAVLSLSALISFSETRFHKPLLAPLTKWPKATRGSPSSSASESRQTCWGGVSISAGILMALRCCSSLDLVATPKGPDTLRFLSSIAGNGANDMLGVGGKE